MKITLENLPASLQKEREALASCLEAFGQCRTVHQVLLFGSHARGEQRPDSDVDLCIVAEGAERQLEAARDFRRAIRHIRPKPAFTLLPISPDRLAEKRRAGDHFFSTVLQEGIRIAQKD